MATFGTQGDISNLCQFKWYDWCYFCEEGKVQFPQQKLQLGCVLGPMKNKGNHMAQSVLKQNGKIIPHRTLHPLTISELNSPSEIEKCQSFDDTIQSLYIFIKD
jgi:hypothetical protein